MVYFAQYPLLLSAGICLLDDSFYPLQKVKTNTRRIHKNHKQNNLFTRKLPVNTSIVVTHSGQPFMKIFFYKIIICKMRIITSDLVNHLGLTF